MRTRLDIGATGLVLYVERSEAKGEDAQAEGTAKAAAKRLAVLAAAEPAVQRAGPQAVEACSAGVDPRADRQEGSVTAGKARAPVSRRYRLGHLLGGRRPERLRPVVGHVWSVVRRREPAARASRRASPFAINATTYRTAASACNHPGFATSQIKTVPPNARTANQ
jgi:hypothetical protein